jgi:hypothetical protein
VKVRLAALVLCASATGCKPGATTLALSIDASAGVTVESLALHLVLGADGDAGVSEALPPSGAVPTLPGRAVVRLPDRAMDVAVSLDGEDADGNPLHAETVTRTVPHEQVSVSLTLGTPAVGDLGGADLATPVDAGLPCTLGARCSYTYRRQLTIHNGAAAALPAGYTVRVPLDPALFPASKVLASLNDVRVFGDAPAGEYTRVIDAAPPGQMRALWIALAKPIAAGANDTSYSIYYGDASAAAPPANPASVFPFYDGFDNGTQLSAIWQTNGGPSVAGGTLTLHMNTADAVSTVAANDTVPTLSALEWRSHVTDSASAGQVTPNGTFWWWAGYQRSGDFTPADPWIIWIQRAATDLHGERKITGSANCANGCNTPTVTPDNNYHWYRIERDAAATRFYSDGVISGSAIVDPNSTDYSVMIRNWAVTSDLVVDWIRGRALASPEPVVTVGGELVN